MTKEEQQDLCEYIKNILDRVKFVSNNLDSKDRHKDVCGQLEVIASRLRELCEEFETDPTEI